MANNRMWLKCQMCGDKFFLAKYYPSQGWYINRDAEKSARLGSDLDAWLNTHKHRTLFGEEMVLVRETDGDEA